MLRLFQRLAVAGFVSMTLTSAAVAQTPLQIVYLGQEGQTSSDGTDPNSWSPNQAPTASDRAVLNGGGAFNKIVDLGANDVHWYQLFLNNNGPAQINGTGTIYLDIPLDADGDFNATGAFEQWSIFTAGGEAFGGSTVPSVINPNVVTKSYIETNGNHSLTFNGDVETLTVQAYAGTTVTFNGDVTLTGDDLLSNAIFLTGNETSPQITFNKNVNLVPWSGGEATGFYMRNSMTVNLGPESSLTSNNFVTPNGWGEVNMYNGSKIRLLGSNKIGRETNLWSRDNPTLTNTLDLNGFNDGVTFLGTHATATFILDYGTAAQANAFEWDTSQFTDGQYSIVNYQISTDSLTFGSPGNGYWFETGDVPTEEAILSRIKINGFSYAPFNLSVTTPYWTVVNPAVSRQVVFQNVASPNADFNGDGIVDGADILKWQDNLGLGGQTTNANGDADRLGTVNGADLVIIKNQFGTNPNAAAAAGAIPEPATVSMLLAGCVGVGLARRRFGR